MTGHCPPSCDFISYPKFCLVPISILHNAFQNSHSLHYVSEGSVQRSKAKSEDVWTPKIASHPSGYECLQFKQRAYVRLLSNFAFFSLSTDVNQVPIS